MNEIKDHMQTLERENERLSHEIDRALQKGDTKNMMN